MGSDADQDPIGSAGSPVPIGREARIESEIERAVRAGEFDDLPGSGKPLRHLDGQWDPDWWIRRKIEDEQLSGLGPPAILLRTEDRGLDAVLDALHRETEVRAALEDFNRRVVAARRQLLGGPPVVTRTRDIEAELARWRERRDARRPPVTPPPPPPPTWRERRRAARDARRRGSSGPEPRPGSGTGPAAC